LLLFGVASALLNDLQQCRSASGKLQTLNESYSLLLGNGMEKKDNVLLLLAAVNENPSLCGARRNRHLMSVRKNNTILLLFRQIYKKNNYMLQEQQKGQSSSSNKHPWN